MLFVISRITNIQSTGFEQWKKSLGTTNIFLRLQPTLLAYCSMRNSEYNQKKKVGCFTVKIKQYSKNWPNTLYIC
jgi:hypothetical protein